MRLSAILPVFGAIGFLVLPARAADPKGAPAAPASATAAAKTDPDTTGTTDTKTSIAAAPALAIPVGNLSSVAGIGLGALLEIRHTVAPQLDVTGRAGFIYHLGKDAGPWSYGISEVPLLGGVRYTFLPSGDGGLYGAAELGLSLVFSRASYSGPVAFGYTPSAGSSDVRLSTALGAGYRLGNLDFRGSMLFLDLGHLGDTMAVVATASYAFASF